MQKRVEKLATDTALGLKKNVYKNYSQFIETAKEISSELYIIRSHLKSVVTLCQKLCRYKRDRF